MLDLFINKVGQQIDFSLFTKDGGNYRHLQEPLCHQKADLNSPAPVCYYRDNNTLPPCSAKRINSFSHCDSVILT
jgi:hypothetical protein